MAKSPAPDRQAMLPAVLAALAVLELAWLGWFLVAPLPNAGNVGGKVRRWILLARAIPEVVPGVRYDQSYLGMALSELGHVENLPQRVPIVLAAALVAGSAVALGRLVFRLVGILELLSTPERLALGFGVGATGLAAITLIVGRLGLLAPWPVRIGLGLLIVVELVCLVASRRDAPRPASAPASDGSTSRARLLRWLGFGVVTGPFLVIMALGAMLPTIDFDATEYHLQGPKEYYLAGRIAFLPHNVYTSMPFNVEMLHLLGMEVLDDWWLGGLTGQLLVALHAPAAAVLIALTARRWGSPRAAWVGSVVYLTTPWIYRIGVIPYVEGPLCYYHVALVWIAARSFGERGDAAMIDDQKQMTDDQWPMTEKNQEIRHRSSVIGHRSSIIDHRSSIIGHHPFLTRLWFVAGLLAGGAMACKYPGLISAVLPFGLLALVETIRRRSWRIVLAYSLGWAVVMTPWLAKNVIDTGNPVYPLAYPVFGGTHWDKARDAQWARIHGPRWAQPALGPNPMSPFALFASLTEVAGESDWQSPLYTALAPLALLRRGSRRQARALWGYVVYLFLTWWLLTHRLDRFWLPILPPLAVLAGLGADWVRNRLWTVILVAVLALSIASNLTYTSTSLAGLNQWTSDLRKLRTDVPRFINPPLARMDAMLPPEAKVLLVGQAGVFHLRHRIVYNTVFNHETIETLTDGRTPEQIREALQKLGVTHVYVDWFEIERYRSPGNYGFTDYVTPELFNRLVASGVLEGPEAMGARQEVYAVQTGRGTSSGSAGRKESPGRAEWIR